MAPARGGEETRESWYGVSNPRERKKIQDRLAQRARRRRLAERTRNNDLALVAPSNHGPPSRNMSTPTEGSESGSSTAASAIDSAGTVPYPASDFTSQSSTSPPGHFLTPSFTISKIRTPLLDDRRFLELPNKRLLIALEEIGYLMGIASIACVGFVKSRRQPPDLPEILQPTPLQLTTPHPIWIDRLPFPRLRDNLILLATTINLYDLYFDLFIKVSFRLKEGMAPYDPAAYRVEPWFKEKWGYLFH